MMEQDCSSYCPNPAKFSGVAEGTLAEDVLLSSLAAGFFYTVGGSQFPRPQQTDHQIQNQFLTPLLYLGS